MATKQTTERETFFPAPLFQDFFNSERFFRNGWLLGEQPFLPAANIVENGTSFRIDLEVPGFSKKDFVVTVEDDRLSVEAEKKQEKKEDNERYARREFAYNSFKRTFTLPQNSDESKIEARYADGILQLTIPKKDAAKPAHKKEIEVG